MAAIASNGIYITIDEAQDYSNANGDSFPRAMTYEDYYQLKIVGPVPDFLDIDWYYSCKAEEPCDPEPRPRPARKQRDKTWKRKTRRHQMMARPPRMHHRQRR